MDIYATRRLIAAVYDKISRIVSSSSKMHAIVYTAIFGAYDTLKQPVVQDQSCKFICFADAEIPARRDGWRVIQVKPDRNLHPRMQAKQFKLLSHRFFPHGRLAWRHAPFRPRRRADISIWIDASAQIKSPSFVRDMRATLGEQDWAMFAHPDRDCIYDEARVSVTMAKYRGLPVVPQAEAYRSIVPPHGGLYAATVIARREPAPDRARMVNALWWEQNLKWTYQDQISLPFVLRQVPKSEPMPIPGNLWSNNWFDLKPHNDEVSATPCSANETERAPSRGVAETLLHEPAGRESSYGDLVMLVAAGDRARSSRVNGGDAIRAIDRECTGAASHILASTCRIPS